MSCSIYPLLPIKCPFPAPDWAQAHLSPEARKGRFVPAAFPRLRYFTQRIPASSATPHLTFFPENIYLARLKMGKQSARG
jgi:hypothetical protein